MKKVIYASIILTLIFSLSSCCKCAADVKHLDTIYVENFSSSEIVNPNVIISYAATKDTVALTIDTSNAVSYHIKLRAPKALDIHGDWLVRMNDSLHYTVNGFQTQTGKRSCCNGVTSLSSFQVNGELKQASSVSIEK